MGFTDRGWKISGGIVVPPADIPIEKAYQFILEAIYDGHLPVYRIIGFNYSSSKINKTTSGEEAVQRYKGCLDDRMTLVANLSKILLLRVTGSKPKTAAMCGTMTVDNMNITYSNKPIIALSPSQAVMRTHIMSRLEFVINKSTGYKDAAHNFGQIMAINGANRNGKVTPKTRFMPMYSYHNIIDFVRVFPLMDNTIRLAYDYGMNDEYLTELFEDLATMKCDPTWLQNYGGML